jgi:hypothetical protein
MDSELVVALWEQHRDAELLDDDRNATMVPLAPDLPWPTPPR